VYIEDLMIFFAMIAVLLLLIRNNRLSKENSLLKKQLNSDIDLEELAKQKLMTSTPMQTIKYLRLEYGLSMLEAKNLVDSLKK
jgi:ribosomal protein L7/L12